MQTSGTGLIDRLRNLAEAEAQFDGDPGLLLQAADKIEHMLAALRPFADIARQTPTETKNLEMAPVKLMDCRRAMMCSDGLLDGRSRLPDAKIVQSSTAEQSKCMAQKRGLICKWPDCGCDPHATKVIEALIVQGWIAPSRTREG